MAHVQKQKKWSKRVLQEARRIVEFNLVNPMYRDDARGEIPLANSANRGFKIDPNTLIILHLRHHRPSLFWDCTISWRKMPPIAIENLSEWAYDLFNLVLTEDEIKAGEWDFMPENMKHPMVTIVTNYIPVASEFGAYNELVRRRDDAEKFDIHRLIGAPSGGPIIGEATPSGGEIVVPTPDQVRQLS